MDAAPVIVVVDDDEAIRDSCRQTLERCGYRVATAADGFSAMKAIHANAPDLVILDLKMPGVDGTELLRRIKAEHPTLDVVVITGYSSVGSAVECMRLGAYDYLPKPFDTDTLRLVVRRAVEKHAPRGRERGAAAHARRDAAAGDTLLGESPLDAPGARAHRARRGRRQHRPDHGRERHRQGARRARDPRVRVRGGSVRSWRWTAARSSRRCARASCSATSRARSRARSRTAPGRFELAHGGTVFLDEIANVGPAMQAKLLRVLQEREITRVGSAQPIAVDVRIVAATNQDLVGGDQGRAASARTSSTA